MWEDPPSPTRSLDRLCSRPRPRPCPTEARSRSGLPRRESSRALLIGRGRQPWPRSLSSSSCVGPATRRCWPSSRVSLPSPSSRAYTLSITQWTAHRHRAVPSLRRLSIRLPPAWNRPSTCRPRLPVARCGPSSTIGRRSTPIALPLPNEPRRPSPSPEPFVCSNTQSRARVGHASDRARRGSPRCLPNASAYASAAS